VNPILDSAQNFADRHPLTVGTIGTGSGIAAAILREIHSAAGLAADLGIIFGCAVSFLMGVILSYRVVSGASRFFLRQRRNMLQRRRHKKDTGPEEDLDELVP
jgi:hypothetical protein